MMTFIRWWLILRTPMSENQSRDTRGITEAMMTLISETETAVTMETMDSTMGSTVVEAVAWPDEAEESCRADTLDSPAVLSNENTEAGLWARS